MKPKITKDKDGSPLIVIPPYRRVFEGNGQIIVLWGGTPDKWEAVYEEDEEIEGKWNTVINNEKL